jgi:transposase
LRGKIPQLREALDGHVSDHHRFMLRTHLEHAEYIERQMASLSERIEALIASGALDPASPTADEAPPKAEQDEPNGPVPFVQATDLLDEIPGIDRLASADILAEIGADMGQYPSPRHLASWSAICPGNNESAGKRKSGKTRKANRWLRRILTQVAWAASRCKKTYFSAQYHRIAHKRGKKRAIIAVAHSILLTAYQMLSHRQHYRELGADFFDRMEPERLKRYHVKRLETLGFIVTLEKITEAA